MPFLGSRHRNVGLASCSLHIDIHPWHKLHVLFLQSAPKYLTLQIARRNMNRIDYVHTCIYYIYILYYIYTYITRIQYTYISYNCTQKRTRSTKSRQEKLHSLTSTKQPIACLDHLPPDLIDLPWPVNWHCKAIICWWCHQMPRKKDIHEFYSKIHTSILYTTNTICR